MTTEQDVETVREAVGCGPNSTEKRDLADAALDRLVNELEKARDYQDEKYDEQADRIASLEAERDRLRAEVERLRTVVEAARIAVEAEAAVRYRREPVMTPRQRELAISANKAIAIDLRDAIANLAEGEPE